MKTYKKKLTKVVNEILCDCCGQSCTKEVPTIKPSFDHEYAELTATWGYFSQQDGQQFDIQLCESCFNEVLDFIKNKRRRVLGCFKYPYDKDPLEGSCYFPV
jgi:hypothetical protein